MRKARKIQKKLMGKRKKSLLSFIFDYTIYGDKVVITPSKRKRVVHNRRTIYNEFGCGLSIRQYNRMIQQGYPIRWCLKGKKALDTEFKTLKKDYE